MSEAEPTSDGTDAFMEAVINLATQKALDMLDAAADTWAVEVGLADMAMQIAGKADIADRERAIDALVRSAFAEGAYRFYCKARDDGVLKDGADTWPK